MNCLIVGISCLAWVGGISAALVYFLDLTHAVGWAIASTLGVSSTVAVTLILYEIRHASDLPDGSDRSDCGGIPAADQWRGGKGLDPVRGATGPALR